MQNDLLNTVLGTVLPILATALAGFAIKWLNAKALEAKSAVGSDTWYSITGAVRGAISAAEQSGLAGIIQNIGASKKAFALDAAQKFLDAQGIKVDLNVLDLLIEAAVFKELKKDPPLPAMGG